MKLTTHLEPFKYTLLEGILTQEENDKLYSICNEVCDNKSDEIDDLSFFILPKDRHLIDTYGLEYCIRNGYVMNNVGIDLTNQNSKIFLDIFSNIRNRLSDLEFTKIFPIRNNSNTNAPAQWHAGLTITSDNKLHQLLPHTDNPEELIQYGIDNNISVSCGIYKGVIYLSDRNLDYPNYGIKLYKSNSIDSLIEEVPFIGGNGCIFETGPNSWHGTYFPDKLLNRRYTVTIEYY
jgi:hypothetical protein